MRESDGVGRKTGGLLWSREGQGIDQVGKVKWVAPKGLVLRGLNQSQEN